MRKNNVIMFNNRKSFVIIFLVFCAGIHLCLGVEKNEECITPKNESGICTHLDNCNEIFELIKNSSATDVDRAYLRQSQCGLDENEQNVSRRVLVCCPSGSNVSSRNKKQEINVSEGDKLPEPGVCGPDFSNRIYGGNLTQIDEFPWMALIQYRKSKLYFGFHCGGTLINSHYVLTAAHCVNSPDMPPTWEIYAVRLGEWDIEISVDCVIDIRGEKDCAPPHRDILIEKAIVHENYIPGSTEQYFDVALLRLSETAEPYTDFIRPICLPLDEYLRIKSYTEIEGAVSGWGTTETSAFSPKKLKALLPLWATNVCEEKYRSYNLHINNSIQICAGGLKGIDTCRGDSGGPLMVTELINKRNIYFAIGIVSYGPRPCALSGWPGVYTRVGFFIDWIQNKLEP